MPRLSTPLQIEHLKDTFLDLNPAEAVDLIDWDHVIDEELTMAENREIFMEEYPQFRWEKVSEVPRLYEAQIIADAREQVAEFSYDVVKSRRLGALGKTVGRLAKVKIALERCRGLKPKVPRKPKITCKESEKVQVCFWRCPR